MGWGVHDYPEPVEEPVPVCPVCGAECEKLYMIGNDVVGCDECMWEQDAYEYMEEMREAI